MTAHHEPADTAEQAGPREQTEPLAQTDGTGPARLHPGQQAVRQLRPAVQLDLHHDVTHVDQLSPTNTDTLIVMP